MSNLNEKDLLALYDLLLEYEEYLKKEIEKVEGANNK